MNLIFEIIPQLSNNIWIQVLSYIILFILVLFIIDRFFFILLKLSSKTETDLDQELITTIRKPLTICVSLFGLILIIDQFSNIFSGNKFSFFQISNKIILTFIIFIFSKTVNEVFTNFTRWYSNKDEYKFIQKQTLPLLDNSMKIFIFSVSLYLILKCWSVDVTAVLASAGVIGIALGFAAKDTISNLFSGIFIMVDSPYKEGDYIILDDKQRGYVQDIGIRSTRIMTRDDVEIIIPNSVIANSKIVNECGGPYEKERLKIPIGVGYDSDIDQVRKILLDIADSSSNVSSDPKPRVRFTSFGDSSLLFNLLVWIEHPEMRGRTIDDINCKIFKQFKSEQIDIPFPQRNIHIEKH